MPKQNSALVGTTAGLSNDAPRREIGDEQVWDRPLEGPWFGVGSCIGCRIDAPGRAEAVLCALSTATIASGD
jgi:hypothetical protein